MFRVSSSSIGGRFVCVAITAAMVGLLIAGCPIVVEPEIQEGPAGPAGPAGPQGETGPQGPAGELPIYGDGSAGDVTVTVDSDFTDLDPDGNYQFASLTINNGIRLTVPTGTVIRCTGAFVNDGTVVVGRGGAGGIAGGVFGLGPAANAHPGVSRRAAGGGASGDAATVRGGGRGGLGLSEDEARLLRDIRPGGGGGGFCLLGRGGDGGGGLRILAADGITNNGTIEANGNPGLSVGSGGGAGGVLLLASPAFVENTGDIRATGGNGADSSANLGAGGGGGGGIIHFISPTIDNSAGVVVAAAGAGGVGGTAVGAFQVGGGGGGACGGNGGAGGDIAIPPGSTASPGVPGEPGHVIESLTDPTAWF